MVRVESCDVSSLCVIRCSMRIEKCYYKSITTFLCIGERPKTRCSAPSLQERFRCHHQVTPYLTHSYVLSLVFESFWISTAVVQNSLVIPVALLLSSTKLFRLSYDYLWGLVSMFIQSMSLITIKDLI